MLVTIMVVGAAVGCVAAYAAARLVARRTGTLTPPTRPRTIACGLAGLCSVTSLAVTFGPRAVAWELAALVAPLIAATLADLDAWLIPRECVWAVLAARALYVMAGLVTGGSSVALSLLAESLLGAFAMGLPLLVAALSMEWTQRSKDSLGGGDVRLLLAVGTVFGWLGAAAVLLLACLLGIVHHLVRYLQKGEGRTFPFAPSIALACWIVALCLPTLETLAARLFA